MQITLRPLRELERHAAESRSLQLALRPGQGTRNPALARLTGLWTRTFRASGKDGKASRN